MEPTSHLRLVTHPPVVRTFSAAPHLVTRTRRQVAWIQAQRGEAKKAGILAAVAKVPTLLKRLQAASDAAVIGSDQKSRKKEKDEV